MTPLITTPASRKTGAMARTGLVAVARRLVISWRSRHVTRVALSRLDPHLLRDIGLQAEEAQTECAKRFWTV